MKSKLINTITIPALTIECRIAYDPECEPEPFVIMFNGKPRWTYRTFKEAKAAVRMQARGFAAYQAKQAVHDALGGYENPMMKAKL